MNEKNKENIKVIVSSNESLGDASPTILFLFTMLTMMFLGLGAGFISGEAVLLLGCIQLGIFPVYLVAGKNSINKNESLSGNCFMIFAALFGGAGGLCNIAAYFAGVFGWPIDGSIMGIVWIWSGVMLLPVVLSMLKGPSLPVIVFAFGGIMLVLFGIETLGYYSDVINMLVLVMQAIVAIGGFYVCIAFLFGQAGISLPLGKPLVKDQKIELSEE